VARDQAVAPVQRGDVAEASSMRTKGCLVGDISLAPPQFFPGSFM